VVQASFDSPKAATIFRLCSKRGIAEKSPDAGQHFCFSLSFFSFSFGFPNALEMFIPPTQ
jgi:hypothetical protein